MFWTNVDEPEGAMMPVAERLKNLVVLPAQLARRGVDDGLVSHVDDQPLDCHSVGEAVQPRHRLVRSPPAKALSNVAVQVPDHHRSIALYRGLSPYGV